MTLEFPLLLEVYRKHEKNEFSFRVGHLIESTEFSTHPVTIVSEVVVV